MLDKTTKKRAVRRKSWQREFYERTDALALWIDENYGIRHSTPSFQSATGWSDPAQQTSTCKQTLVCKDASGRVLCETPNCPLRQVDAGFSTIIFISKYDGAALPMIYQTTSTQDHLTLLTLHDASVAIKFQRQRDKFLSDVSHKMRNRLNSIHGFVELVASGHAGPIDSQQQLMLTYAHMSSMELMEYVENLVYMTRTDQLQLALSIGNVHIGDLLEEVTQYLDFVAAAAQVHLYVDAPDMLPEIQGDHYLLRHAVSNIAMNAIKFTSPDGSVRIRATSFDDKVHITVEDTGVGIDPEDITQIFDPSYQSERMAYIGKSSGGMGLATAKTIIEQHHGSLDVTSVPDSGTTFVIHLPILQPGDF